MAIKVGGTEVIDNARALKNITTVDATTVSALQSDLNLGTAATGNIGTDVLAYDANLQGFVDTFTLPTTDGTAGQVLATDGAGNITLASAGGSNFTATASGSISNGKPVVVNSDATVSELSGTLVNQSLGPITTFQSSVNLTDADITYDQNAQRLFLAYRDNSGTGQGYGYATVGTITGNSISFGTGSQFEAGNRADTMCTIYDPSTQKTLLFYGFGSFSSIFPVGRVVTISGSSYSVGPQAQINSVNGSKVRSVAYDSTNQKVIISYNNVNNYPVARVCTVSGTSLSYGTEAIAESSLANYINVVYDSVNQKVVLIYRDSNSYLAVAVGTVSGTSITFGTPVKQTSYTVQYVEATFDPESGKILVVTNTGTPNVGHALTVTVSGNSATFGTPVPFTDFIGFNFSSVYDPVSKKVIIAVENDTDPSDRGEIVAVKILGDDTFIFDSTEIFDTSDVTDVDLTFDTTGGQSVLISRTTTPITRIEARTFTSKSLSTNLTEDNFVGFSEGDCSDGQPATIQVVGSVEDSQTGLTAGEKYYVKFDGSLTTSSTPSSVDEIQTYAGVSLSPTKLLVKG